MCIPAADTPIADRELSITRDIDAPPEALFRCWTEPALLEQWFCPRPWRVTDAELDVRPGGTNAFVMHGPDGERFPNRGVYLEVVPNRRLVLTDAFVNAWEPSTKAFMVTTITFEPLPSGGTRYTATARHWSADDRDQHDRMGFHEGWGACADQLAELATSL